MVSDCGFGIYVSSAYLRYDLRNMDKIKRNFILNTIFQVMRLLTPLVVTPYISRVLGVDGVGIFSYTYSVQYYFSIFAVLGTVGYGAREIARQRDDKEKLSCLFWEIWLLAVCTSLVSLSVWTILILCSGQYQIYYLILTFYVLAAMVDISWFYTGLEKFPVIVLRNIALRLTEVALVFLLVKKPEHLYIYFLIMAGGTFLGNVSLWGGMGKNLAKVRWREIRPFRHLKGTLVFFLPTIATSIYTVLDKTLIGLITKNTAENGAYEQATKIIDVAKAVSFVSLNTVLGPRSAYLFAQKKIDEAQNNLKSSLSFMLMLGVGMSCGIIGVADIFVPWFYGEGFEGVVLLLRCLAPIIVVITISNALGYQYYDPAGLRLKSAKYLVVGACCNLVLNCLLIPKFAGAGAVIGSVASEFVISALYLKNCDGYLRLGELIRMGWKKLAAGIVMLVFLLYRQNAYQPVVLDMVLLVVQGVAVYFAMLIILQDSMLIGALKSGIRKMNNILSKGKKV